MNKNKDSTNYEIAGQMKPNFLKVNNPNLQFKILVQKISVLIRFRIAIPTFHAYNIRGITRSTSARRQKGDGFDARPTPHHK